MEKSSLTALARQQLEIAARAPSGRGAATVHGGHEHVLRPTVIAHALQALADSAVLLTVARTT